MQLTNIFTTALLASAAMANPIGAAESQENTLVRRGGKPPSSCGTKGGSISNYWVVYMADNTMGNWGQGLLDNLRGRCGMGITNWQGALDNHGGVACSFNTSKFCQANDVSAAINAASGKWVYCNGDTLNGLFDTAGNLIKGYTDYLQAVGSILGSIKK